MEGPEIRQRSIRIQDPGETTASTGREDQSANQISRDSEEDSNSSSDIECQIRKGKPGRKRRRAEIKARDNVNSFFTLIVFVGLSFLFVKYMDGRLPTALTVQDSFEDSSKFIEERARQDLHSLISVGVRVSGSRETDVLTVQELERILNEIKLNQSKNRNVSIQIQRPSGEFFMDDDEGHLSTYAKISNVIAKLEPADAPVNSSSVLVNCHFDTKPGSPGATDNMISCATMLEVLRVMSRNAVPLKNAIIFLFNGAEELGLQGAHGFVAGRTDVSLDPGHPWAANLRTFVNLEGAGAGGREILFQSGPGNGWVLKAYINGVERPYGLVIAEEAFQLGLIPSDTDYRIFRDFSDIPGLDMAFIKNGWVYHTKWDKLTEIPAGSIQHMGANALGLLEYFGALDFSIVETSEGKMVFFDVFGLFMVYYTEIVGIVVNNLIGIISIVLVCLEVFVLDGAVLTTPRIQKLPKDKPIIEKLVCLVWLPISTILAWGAGILVVFLIALVFNWAGCYKPFYSYPTMSFVLFGIPAVIAQAIVFAFAHQGSEHRTWLAVKITIAILVHCTTFITRVAYVFMIILLIGFIGRYVAKYATKWSRIPNKALQRLLIYLIIGELIPFTLACYLTITLADVFVPILGRSGTETDPNVFFGLIVAGIISILAFNGLVSILSAYSKPILIASLCFSVFIINPLMVFGFVGEQPFQEKTPMRLQIVDVDRTWYEIGSTTQEKRSDSGYWFWPIDPNTFSMLEIIGETVPEVNSAIELDANSASCEDIYCAQPFLWPTTELIKKTPWIPKGNLPKAFRDKLRMNVLNNTPLPGGGRRVHLSIFGPSTQLTVVLSPGPNFRLNAWSFGGSNTSVPEHPGLRWKGRPTYFIYHGKGHTASQVFEIVCDFNRENPPVGGGENTVVDIMLTGSFLYGDDMMTPEFVDFASKLPSWTNVMGWTTIMKIFAIS